MTRILGVHGIGNYKHHRRTGSPDQAAAVLATDWATNLQTVLPPSVAVHLDIAYYAHHLHRGTPQGPVDDPSTLEPEVQEWLVDWAELIRPDLAIPQGPRTIRARQAADWFTSHFGPTARTMAIAFCREVHTYLAKPDSPRRAAARRTVAEAIRVHRPNVIVAHSLGSVVTYEALWTDPGHDVELLVTLGSPLAMPGVILPRLQPHPDIGGKPPRTRRWLNLADVGDIVAIPRSGLRPHFDGVEQDIPVVIGDWDFHTAGAYLRTREVGLAITS
ncbi:serine peptidase [Kibdelosporangium lantanae]|uniref:Serine peptidase n=1 Tax=Kibdelosporangium lantanae TaxID=1497396 RepID=A0ABW3M3Y6_9PSEU